MPPDRPCAVVQWGTTNSQRTVTGPLSDIARMAEEAGLSNPAAFVVGEVTSLRDELGWFDNRPLFGKKALVTRTRTQASRLRSLLEQSGAECVEFPAISIVPLEDPSRLDEAVANLGRYDWVVFSSSNGVHGLASRLEALGGDARSFAGVKVAAVGPATGETVKAELGISADLVPDEYVSEAIVQALAGEGIEGKKILAIRSDLGRDTLEKGLSAAGAQVDAIVGYETKAPEDSGEKATAAFDAGIDITTFTSSSGVDNLVDLLGGDATRVNDTVVACMGPITAARAEERGVRVDVIATERTMEALVASIVEHLS
jgi:uroporphyrinogen III methyltransferase/synthase